MISKIKNAITSKIKELGQNIFNVHTGDIYSKEFIASVINSCTTNNQLKVALNWLENSYKLEKLSDEEYQELQEIAATKKKQFKSSILRRRKSKNDKN